ncbi:MAG: hypothetical protein Q8N15_07215, partial [Bacillota bacterium]|nr:hypothetical protein [Bacillota bacterium]
GKQLADNAAMCPGCGHMFAPVGPAPKVADPTDAPSTGYGVLGFFFPIIGLILFLVWQDNFPKRGKSAGKGALIGVILQVVLSIVYVVVLVIIMSIYGGYGYWE